MAKGDVILITKWEGTFLDPPAWGFQTDHNDNIPDFVWVLNAPDVAEEGGWDTLMEPQDDWCVVDPEQAPDEYHVAIALKALKGSE